MSRIFLGIVLLLVILLLAYAIESDSPYIQRSYWMSNFVESPWAVYRRSGGALDAAAELAFSRASGRDVPTPSDRLLRAMVISRNVIAQEHRPAVGRDGVVARPSLERARLRREMFDAAREDFMAAVRGVRVDAPPAEVNAQFLVDAAMGFAFEGLGTLLANDPIIAAQRWDFNNIVVVRTPDGGAGAVDAALAGAVAQRREEIVADRQRAANAAVTDSEGARGAGVEAYVALATTNTSDPQNTHDSGVLACLRATLARLREDQAGAKIPTPDEVAEEVNRRGAQLSEGRAHKLTDVLEVIARANNGDRVVALDAGDAECLGRVWLRTLDPRNAPRRAQLQRALFDALYDCWEDGIVGRSIVCVNGRVSRILSSLILLDWDERNWSVKKLEQFKNDIFAGAARAIDAEASRAAESHDAEERRAGRAYLARSAEEARAVGPVPKEAEEALAQRMRVAVSAMVDEYVEGLEKAGVSGAVPNYMVEAVRQEAMAAVS